MQCSYLSREVTTRVRLAAEFNEQTSSHFCDEEKISGKAFDSLISKTEKLAGNRSSANGAAVLCLLRVWDLHPLNPSLKLSGHSLLIPAHEPQQSWKLRAYHVPGVGCRTGVLSSLQPGRAWVQSPPGGPGSTQIPLRTMTTSSSTLDHGRSSNVVAPCVVSWREF